MKRPSVKAIGWVTLCLVGALVLLRPAPARAQTQTPEQPTAQPGTATSADCLLCHSRPQLSMLLPDGEPLSLAIDGLTYAASLHGRWAMACTDCHTTLTGYPHQPLTAQDKREVARQFSDGCQSCHPNQFARQQDSVHQEALARGNAAAAVCSDCHNPHDTSAPAEPRSKIVATCGQCHSGIAEEYGPSVHGAALLNEDNPDVPSCIDCHGVHNIANPIKPQFLNRSPQLCASCHTDAGKMARYGLNTAVLNTYVADFHGTTVALFEKHSPDQLTNTPLCIDCHGTHAIKSIKDPDSPVIKANLLTTCRQCHPDATTSFPGAWLSHYSPSLQHAPLVYMAGAIYRLMIPLVIGGMVLFVAADASRRFIQRRPGARP
jgi:predicted CXXCH cytochrome family protein